MKVSKKRRSDKGNGKKISRHSEHLIALGLDMNLLVHDLLNLFELKYKKESKTAGKLLQVRIDLINSKVIAIFTNGEFGITDISKRNLNKLRSKF